MRWAFAPRESSSGSASRLSPRDPPSLSSSSLHTECSTGSLSSVSSLRALAALPPPAPAPAPAPVPPPVPVTAPPEVGYMAAVCRGTTEGGVATGASPAIVPRSTCGADGGAGAGAGVDAAATDAAGVALVVVAAAAGAGLGAPHPRSSTPPPVSSAAEAAASLAAEAASTAAWLDGGGRATLALRRHPFTSEM